jgi:hypothetical protein
VVIILILFFFNPDTRNLQTRINGASVELKKLLKASELVLDSEEGAIKTFYAKLIAVLIEKQMMLIEQSKQ